MIQCYDWEENTLKLETSTGFKFNLKIKGKKTIVQGESATGKTMLCNTISQLQKSLNSKELSRYDFDNILIINQNNIEEIRTANHKLIIIDRADLILRLNEPIIEFINSDRSEKNRYLIFSRVPLGIELSPNYFADMIVNEEDREITLHYKFNVKGWT